MDPLTLDLTAYSFPTDMLSVLRKCTLTDSGCWEYPNYPLLSKSRFPPRVTINGRKQALARFVYEHTNGPLESGEMIWRTCRNVQCVNPLHLIVGDSRKRWYKFERRLEMKGE